MNDSREQMVRRLMSGDARGPAAMVARLALAAAEPLYRGVVGARNALYDRSAAPANRLPRPVISVGNLTTGGTGKTPAVQWIVRELIAAGRRPAVLLRGYRRSADASASDEEQLLRDSLGCVVVADADRVRGGGLALERDPRLDVFVLDDGFQHRRLYRDLDVVLIDATNPFGYDHVLPRGMLRESVSGLRRADLVMLTRTDLADAATLERIEAKVLAANARVPIVHTTHALGRVVGTDGEAHAATLVRRRVFAFCGIGNPKAFTAALRRVGIVPLAERTFPDHHAYRDENVRTLRRAAIEAGADCLLTTEKDWVKLAHLAGVAESGLPILRIGVSLLMGAAPREAVLQVLNATLTGRHGGSPGA